MKKNIKKLFKEDFRKSYSCNYNKEEVMLNFVVKEKNKGLIHTTKRKLILQYCLIGLLGIVIGISIYHFKDSFNGNNDVITEEFREYLKEQGYRSTIEKEQYLITIEKKIDVYIYVINLEKNSDSKYYSYYFLIKVDNDESYRLNAYGNTYQIKNDSFGILKENYGDQSSDFIEFSIEVDGQIKKYVLS